jgi:ribosomal protein S18 acetylase RimI-like enzyme
VSDAFQNRGIGSALVQRLIEFARDEKLELLAASFLADNEPIAKLFKSRGFTINDGLDPEVRQAELRLS